MHVEIYDAVSKGSPVKVSKLIIKTIICVKNPLKKTSEKKKGKNVNYLITL